MQLANVVTLEGDLCLEVPANFLDDAAIKVDIQHQQGDSYLIKRGFTLLSIAQCSDIKSLSTPNYSLNDSELKSYLLTEDACWYYVLNKETNADIGDFEVFNFVYVNFLAKFLQGDWDIDVWKRFDRWSSSSSYVSYFEGYCWFVAKYRKFIKQLNIEATDDEIRQAAYAILVKKALVTTKPNFYSQFPMLIVCDIRSSSNTSNTSNTSNIERG